MKKALLFILFTTTILFSCKQSVPKQDQNTAGPDIIITTPTIEEDIEECEQLISKYDDLIDKTLSGDVEAFKKISITTEKITTRIENLKTRSKNFTSSQLDKFAEIQHKFTKISGRLR